MGFETPGERRERISETTARRLDRFLETQPDLALTSHMRQIGGAQKVLMLVEHKGLMTLDDQIIDLALRFQATHIEPKADMGNDDCAQVAGEANLFFRAHRIGSQSISTKGAQGKVPLFKDLGYRHHVMNVLRLRGGRRAALDFSAHYSMDAMQGRYDVFGVLAPSEADLKRDLLGLYGSSWD